jgi:glycosyltransferase involved in cell wall biosynthesis
VHTHSSKPGLLGRIAATIAKVPNIIHTSHGSPFYLGQKHITFLLYRELERLACLFGNKIVFVNNDHRKYYIQHRLVAAHKASTIYNALIPELQKSLESCVRNPENQQEAITIGSILRFSQQKNIIQTLEVCIRICLARNDVNFCFVGDGEHYPLCQQMVQTHHLQERIQLPGWSNQSVMWLQSFDIFMLYSLYEGLPISIIEAMHAGLPILASDIMGNSELVTTCNGWLVSPDNPVELEKTLHIAINSRTSLVRLGQTSRLLVIQRCSYSDFINGYLSLYKERN